MKRTIKMAMVMTMVMVTMALTGCGEAYSELGEESARLEEEYAKLEEEYAKLEGNYSELEDDYSNLKESYEKVQNLPDLSVTLIDDKGETVKLDLCTNYTLSMKNPKGFYRKDKVADTDTIEFIVESKTAVEDMYWCNQDGSGFSFMDRVKNIENTYVFRFNTFDYENPGSIDTIAIKTNGNVYYTSFYEE